MCYLHMDNHKLLQKLIHQTGLPEDKAIQALATIAGYAKEKFPILEGTINSYLKEEFKESNPDLLSRLLDEE